MSARRAALLIGFAAALAAVTVAGVWRARRGQPAPASRFLMPHEIPGTTLDEATAKELLPFLKDSGWSRYDERAIVRPYADRSQEVRWPEHEGGGFTLRTNSSGFREDEPTALEPAGPRVIVGGDSHVFGLVSNDEIVGNVLERLLAEPDAGAGAGERVEVICAGVSGTGPDEQLALMRELMALRPDVYVIVFYEGNDFSNTLSFADFRSKRVRPPIDREAGKRFLDVRERGRAKLAQSLGQAFHFAHRPGEDELALEAALAVVREMAATCRRHGVELVLAVLPAKEDVDEDLDAGSADAPPMRVALGLTVEQAQIGMRLGRRLAETLRSEGLVVVDLYPAMKAVQRPMFWSGDHHLSVQGHALAASLLRAPVKAALERRR